MGTNCTTLVADLFLFCHERDFMTSLSDDNQAGIIEAFNSNLRYLDDLLDIDNPYSEGKVNQIYPTALKLNKANTSDTEAPFWIYICLFLMILFPPKVSIQYKGFAGSRGGAYFNIKNGDDPIFVIFDRK